MGIFGNVFDFDCDGQLNCFEQAAEFGAFMEMMEAQKNEQPMPAGLNPMDLTSMGESEGYQALEQVGLDPEDYYL